MIAATEIAIAALLFVEAQPSNKALERSGGEPAYFNASGGGRRPLSAGEVKKRG